MKIKSHLFYINEIRVWKRRSNKSSFTNNYKDVYGLINFFHNWFPYKEFKTNDFLKELWGINYIYKDVTNIFITRKKAYELFNLFGIIVEKNGKKYWNIEQKETILLILCFWHNYDNNDKLYFHFFNNFKIIYFTYDLLAFINTFFQQNNLYSQLINHKIAYEKKKALSYFSIKEKNLEIWLLKVLILIMNILILFLKQNKVIDFDNLIIILMDYYHFERNYLDDTKLFLLHQLQKEIFFIKKNKNYFNKWNLAMRIYDFISLYIVVMRDNN